MLKPSTKIYVAGHRGLVGRAMVRQLEKAGFHHLILESSQALDLRNQRAVQDFFKSQQPEVVVMCAAKVGGIGANSHLPAEFIYDNLMIQSNILHEAYVNRVEKLLFLGSSCIYPKNAQQPLQESFLLSGALEPTNQPYAIAKIAGIEMAQAYHRQYGCCFISAMPSNLYGPGDNYDLNNSHVLPALMRKFHEAKITNAPSVSVWGTGQPLREFLHVDDLSRACLLLLNSYEDPTPINIGSHEEVSILELARLISQTVGYSGKIFFDSSKPDGTQRKKLETSRIEALGFSPKISLMEGLS
ncbi:MAG: GDP-L-fucose synthase, partial [Cyanobacteria bacterium]|nr:GDP-L-fucose synthase [Cyanobacteriota bacterium]